MNKKVAILMGGLSGEAEVSKNSAINISQALKAKGFDSDLIEVNKNFLNWVVENKNKYDFIFNALHGTWGEDGKIQGILEYLQIPYTHSGVTSSALCMNKEITKKVLTCHNLKTPNGKIINKEDFSEIKKFPRPFVIKPNCEGSSLGIHLIKENTILENILKKLNYRELLIEEYIPGREITVAVFNKKALGILEIKTKTKFYDYEAKYLRKDTKYVMPKGLSEEALNKILHMAELAFEVLNCSGVARVDFRFNEKLGLDGIIILEVNTQPGFTRQSLVPKIAQNAGIEFNDLVEKILNKAGINK